MEPEGWGRWGSASEHQRYMEEIPVLPGRKRRCGYGCGKPSTHMGMANGLCLTSGCEWHMRIWVRDGDIRYDWVAAFEKRLAEKKARKKLRRAELQARNRVGA